MTKKGIPETRLQLLSNVSGVFSPGVLTALVGASGAGKTTLMDVLAGRKTGGYIEGEIRISGHPKEQRTFARISGYVEQNDIHSPQVTVEESLIFSSALRLPKEVIPEKKRVSCCISLQLLYLLVELGFYFLKFTSSALIAGICGTSNGLGRARFFEGRFGWYAW